MASTSLRLGLKIVHRRIFASKMVIQCARISSISKRGDDYDKVKPWPYKEKGFSNWHALFSDGTKYRLGENSKVVLVEGLPCLGKTEVAKSIAKEFDMKHFPMATVEHLYINYYGYDAREADAKLPPKYRSFVVDDFIKNPKDHRSPSMQFIMFYLKFHQYVDALAHVLNTGDGVVLERSVYSDLVFLEAMRAMDYVNKDEQKAYYRYKAAQIGQLMKPHLVVYLDAKPETVVENLKRRGKGEEKVYNKEFLEKMEHSYKHEFLEPISEHAEVLVYDWNVPGDPEIIVEDIERIDFEEFEKREWTEPKMSEWRLMEDADYTEHRYFYTDKRQRFIMDQGLVNYHHISCPRLYVPGEDAKIIRDIRESMPGSEWAPGYDPNQGDKVYFKSKSVPFFGYTWK